MTPARERQRTREEIEAELDALWDGRPGAGEIRLGVIHAEIALLQVDAIEENSRLMEDLLFTLRDGQQITVDCPRRHY